MSRNTFWEMLRPAKPRKFTRKEITEIAHREFKRLVIVKGLLPDPAKQPPKYKWKWQLDACGGCVEANTRGEARARIKQKLNLPQRSRLPKEIQIERLPNVPAAI